MAINEYIGVRGGARTGYLIPGCDGIGAWARPEILPSPSPSPSSPSPPSPKMRLFDKSQILSILTHSRDTDALLPGKLPELRQDFFVFIKSMMLMERKTSTYQKMGFKKYIKIYIYI